MRERRFRTLLMIALLLGAIPLAASIVRASPWSDQHAPSAGQPDSIGKTDAGCLAGGEALPYDGLGYEVIRLSRVRYFGHPLTVDFVETLGRADAAAKLAPFYVGDMSLPRGGPMPNGHASHQTGIDVDIWFNMDAKAVLPPQDREDVPLPSMLTKNGAEIDPAHFDARQVTLLRLAATNPRVDRIFVNPVIKRALCRGAYASAEGTDRSWLHRLRPWPGHDDHFHVRLTCPADSPDCVSQAPIPPGDGCDATLDAWFKPHFPRPAAGALRKPVLPAACRRLIQH
jgi:penicillin-insensitive murein endopeptidase